LEYTVEMIIKSSREEERNKE